MNLNNNSTQIYFMENKSDLITRQNENLNLVYPYTKFTIPLMQSTITVRKSLLSKIDHALSKKLTIIYAPAGYGKTTMVSSWIHNRNYKDKVLWITLDQREDSLYSFWHCITLGLYNQSGKEFVDCLKLFNAYSIYPIESIINLLVNSLVKIEKDILIVFDDFQNIKNNEILNSIKSFLNLIPNNTHVLLISRNKPKLVLSKLKIWDEVLELSINDLKFSVEEIKSFINNDLNLRLDDSEINELYDHTEGWITPIKLVATSLIHNPNKRGIVEHLTSSYKCLDEFLFDEIIQEYPTEIQEFILNTSLLDTMNVSLCNYFMEINNSNEILGMLLNNHLLIFKLDSSQNSFSYHGLFADILRNRMQQKSTSLIKELYLRASIWHEKEGNIHDAIHYAIKSDNLEHSTRLVEAYSDRLLYGSDYFKLIQYVDALPNEVLRKPLILLRYAIALTHTLKHGIPDTIIQEKGIDLEDDLYSEYKAVILIFKATSKLRQGNFMEALEYSKKSIEATNPESKFSGYIFYNASRILTLCGLLTQAANYMDEAIKLSEIQQDYNLLTLAIHHKSLILFLCLQLEASRDVLIKALDLITDENEVILMATAPIYLHLANLYYEFDDINNALYFANKALKNSLLRNDLGCAAQAYLLLARANCANNDIEKTKENLKLAADLFNKDTTDFYSYQYMATLVKIAVVIDDLDFAEELVQKSLIMIPYSIKFFYYLALAELLIGQKKYEEAIVIIEKVDAIDLGDMKKIFSMYINNQFAICYYGLNEKDRFYYYINTLMEMNKEIGFIRTPVEYGSIMFEMLKDFIEMAESKNDELNISTINYAKMLLTHFDLSLKEEPKYANINLTTREIEILNCLLSGATNQDIAEKLYLSINTVKKHLKNIFEKLKVKNRLQAVDLFKKLK